VKNCVKKILNQPPGARSLYRPAFEKDNCGFGLIAQMDNQPSHWLVQTAIAVFYQRFSTNT